MTADARTEALEELGLPLPGLHVDLVLEVEVERILVIAETLQDDQAKAVLVDAAEQINRVARLLLEGHVGPDLRPDPVSQRRTD